jgi:CMP-N,N'-diacetyllegionaminic acid synthase
MDMRVIGLIPARSGSQGIPQKNIRALCGKPLLAYTAEPALASRYLARVILSTDSEEIANVGRACGLEVPFLRPLELSGSDTPTLPVIQHAVRTLEEEGEVIDAVCLLQPTSPLRGADEIDACIEMLCESSADAIVSLRRVPSCHNPWWVYVQDLDGYFKLMNGQTEPVGRRQDLPDAYFRDGAVYVTRRDVLIEGNSLYGNRLLGCVCESGPYVNIDTTEDWEKAEAILYGERSLAVGR